MQRHFKDEGLVIRKKEFQDEHLSITLFSQKGGKITVFGFGVKRLTSRRLSHLETGNYLQFSYTKNLQGNSLGETDLRYGYSKIRRSQEKLSILFTVFVVLNKILPEDEPESVIFQLTLDFLKELNNKSEVETDSLKVYLLQILLAAGFIDDETAKKPLFDPVKFTENLIGRRIGIHPHD